MAKDGEDTTTTSGSAGGSSSSGSSSISSGSSSSSSGGGGGGGKGVNKERERESKAADSVTDFHDEHEGDLSKAQAALESVSSEQSSASTKELFTGQLAPEDVAMVAEECDLTPAMATQLLQENQGSVVAALKAYIRQ